VAPREPLHRADTQGSASARRPAHRSSRRGRSAIAAKPEATSGGPVLYGDVSASDEGTPGEQPALTGCLEDNIVTLPPGIEIADCGIDTVSFCWRPQSEQLWTHLREPLQLGSDLQGWDPETDEFFASSGVARTQPGHVLVNEIIGGGRVGYFPGERLIYIEGRLAALNACDANASGLAPPWQLDNTSRLSALAVTQLLYPSSICFEKCTLRRLDLACDVRFTEGAQGSRFLRALGALDLPRQKSDVWRKDGRTETIYYRTPKRGKVKLRVYDKGVESGSHAPGERVRLEQQLRWTRAKQPDPATIACSDLGSKWQGQLHAWEDAENVVVADLDSMQRVILQAVAEKQLPIYQAERLLGTLAMRGRGFGKETFAADGKRHLWARRSRELRALGFVLDEDGLGTKREQATLPLGTILRALRQAWPSATPEEAS
jgi:hypothetical protein